MDRGYAGRQICFRSGQEARKVSLLPCEVWMLKHLEVRVQNAPQVIEAATVKEAVQRAYVSLQLSHATAHMEKPL